jgi:hypothetical protein
MRDAYHRREMTQLNAECKDVLHEKYIYTQYWALNCVVLFIVGGSYAYKAWTFEDKIEAAYLNSLPARSYESEDYDFKFWELPLTVKDERLGEVITPESVCNDRYVLLYHAKTDDSQMAMQRFSRLKKHVMLRKNVNFESVFVSLDDVQDVEKLHEYVHLYSNDVLAAFAPDEELRASLRGIFQNIGCIYVLAKDTGNVICIVDPRKLPVSVMSVAIITSISKHEDRLLTEDISKRSLDFRVGKQDIFSPKPPTY